MLVLTRRLEEKIKIGDNIVISVLDIEGGAVKIGIEAPKDIQILRMEILEQIESENIRAVRKADSDVGQAAELFKNRFEKKR